MKVALDAESESLPLSDHLLPKSVKGAQAHLDSALRGAVRSLNLRPLTAPLKRTRGGVFQNAAFHIPVEYRDLVYEIDLPNVPNTEAAGFLGFRAKASGVAGPEDRPASWILWYVHRGQVRIRTRARTGECVEKLLQQTSPRTSFPVSSVVAQFLDALIHPRTPEERRVLALRILRHGTRQRPRSQPDGAWHGISHGLASFEFRIPWDHSPASRNTTIGVLFDRAINARWALLLPGSSPEETDLDGLWLLVADDPNCAGPMARVLDPYEAEDPLYTQPFGDDGGAPQGVPKGIVPPAPLYLSEIFRGFVGGLSKRWHAKEITEKENVSIGDRITFGFRPTSAVIQIRRVGQVSTYSEGQTNQVFVLDEHHPLLATPFSELLPADQMATASESGMTLLQALQKPDGFLLPSTLVKRLECAALFSALVPYGSSGELEIHVPGGNDPLFVLKTFLGPRAGMPFVHFNLGAVVRLLAHTPGSSSSLLARIKAGLPLFREPSWHLLIPRGIFYDLIYFRNSQTPWVIRHNEYLLLARRRSELPEIDTIVETENLMRELGGKATESWPERSLRTGRKDRPAFRSK